MSLSDKRIKSSLELTVNWFYDNLPDRKSPNAKPFGTEIIKGLQQRRKYNQETSSAFFRAVFWYLSNEGNLKVETGPEIIYAFNKPEEKKRELVSKIFAVYGNYIRANYEYSRRK